MITNDSGWRPAAECLCQTRTAEPSRSLEKLGNVSQCTSRCALCAPASLCGVHLRMLDGPYLVSMRECSEWTPGHSWTPCSSFKHNMLVGFAQI